MNSPNGKAFVQARMSSNRFPGKVLAPLHGKPIILHVLERLHSVFPKEDVVVLTSIHPSDDPLHAYLLSLNLPVFRGNLRNTFLRFREALQSYPCHCFYRISGDSPLIAAQLFHRMNPFIGERQPDVVTNIFPRSFPKGQSLELIRTDSFMRLDPTLLNEAECEHVTPYFYNHPDQFTIVNVANPNAGEPAADVVVDTIADLKSLEDHWDCLTGK